MGMMCVRFNSRYRSDHQQLRKPDKDAMKMFDNFNSRHPTIKFTFAKQNGGKLPFLDILISNESDNFIDKEIKKNQRATKENTNIVYNNKSISLGIVTHNDILKIYRIVQYFKNIFKCNTVKNIFKIYKQITFLLKKVISV